MKELEEQLEQAEQAASRKEREAEELMRTKEMVARQTEKLEQDMKAWKSGT